MLVEGDDMTEPVADETRSILDGHIVLSRKLAAANHYPAIDVLASASRVMGALVSPAQGRGWPACVNCWRVRRIELLLKVGEYKKGADRVADVAIERARPSTRLPAAAHARVVADAAINNCGPWRPEPPSRPSISLLAAAAALHRHGTVVAVMRPTGRIMSPLHGLSNLTG